MLIQPAYNPLCSFEKNILKLKATPRKLIKITALYAPMYALANNYGNSEEFSWDTDSFSYAMLFILWKSVNSVLNKHAVD